MCLTVFKAVMDMGKGEEEESKTDRKLIRRLPPTDTDKWNALPQVPNRTEVGYLHLSFEYHKGALRVRVWQISDLLLPPPQISMIHSIFVRGYFLPDKVKKTHRRTEEVVVDIPDKDGVDGATTGIQHIFTPSSFKFSTPLLYTGMTTAIIRERSLQLEVCLTQKHTHRVYLTAMVHMPLRTALRRPIRERYPLIPCLNHTTPNNMRIYSATFLPHLTGGNSQGQERKGDQPNGLVGNGLSGKEEAELEEDAVSLTGDDFLRSHLSLCLDQDSDEEGLARSSSDRMAVSQASSGVGSGTSSSSSNTLNNPSSGDEADHGQCEESCNDESQDVRSDPGIATARNTPLDRSLSDTSDVSATKKKIVPNELLEKDCHELNTAEEESRTVNGIPDSSLEQPVKEIPESSASNTTMSPVLDSSLPSDKNDNIQSEDPKTSQGLNNSVNSVRRKIIPDAVLDIPRDADSEEKRTQRDDLSRNGPSSEVAGDRSQKEKDASVTESQIHTQDSSPPTKPTNTINTTNNTQPPAVLADSDSLAPANPPAPTSLSPLTDSGFASRPETPCWDFYDFSEDLKPELDLETGSRCLEEGLAQLRQEGMGSLQNLSLEPILPMVLVDDFDTLTVDDE